MNKYQEDLNKKIKETKKNFEEMFGGACSYHEENKWGRKTGIFTIKLENNNKDSNQEIEKHLKKKTGTDITFHGKNNQGVYVISGKFKNLETEKQKNKLTEESTKDDKKSIENPEKSLNRYFIDNGDSSTYSAEKESKDIAIKETYHEPRNKKEQIIEQNKAQREKEEKQKSQFENSENKSTGAEKSIQLDKNNDFSLPTKIVIGSGIILTPILLVGIVKKWKNK